MTSVGVPICMYCKHYRDDMTCSAYPTDIPDDIYMSAVDHRKSYKGDNGIQFEVKPGSEEDANDVIELYFGVTT